jgi:hypothetical protein
MSDNQYIKKQQRARTRSFLTTRNIVSLMVMSVVIYAGFYFEYGTMDDGSCDGACESLHSLSTWVLAAGMIFASVIAAAAVVGALVAFIKWSRARKDDTLSTLIGEDPTQDNAEKY